MLLTLLKYLSLGCVCAPAKNKRSSAQCDLNVYMCVVLIKYTTNQLAKSRTGPTASPSLQVTVMTSKRKDKQIHKTCLQVRTQQKPIMPFKVLVLLIVLIISQHKQNKLHWSVFLKSQYMIIWQIILFLYVCVIRSPITTSRFTLSNTTSNNVNKLGCFCETEWKWTGCRQDVYS